MSCQTAFKMLQKFRIIIGAVRQHSQMLKTACGMSSEQDRRVVRRRLTQAGGEILARAPRPLTGLMIDALNKMPEAARIRLDAELAGLIEHLNLVDQRAANVPLSNLMR